MEEDDQLSDRITLQYCRNGGIMSPEIVEIGEDSRSMTSGRDGAYRDVYVAVGKDDLGVVKWALDHLIPAAGGRVFLVHVFSPITHIPTPVGKLSRSQLSHDQVRVYVNEETNRRRNLLQKYIRLCSDSKVPVDTMLIESNATAKAILDLIPVLNITNLVIGTKRSPQSRRLVKKLSKGEFVKRNAPDFCEVTIVFNGQKVAESEQPGELNHRSMAIRSSAKDVSRHSGRKFLRCACFSVCRPEVEEFRDPISQNSEQNNNARIDRIRREDLEVTLRNELTAHTRAKTDPGINR